MLMNARPFDDGLYEGFHCSVLPVDWICKTSIGLGVATLTNADAKLHE